MKRRNTPLSMFSFQSFLSADGRRVPFMVVLTQWAAARWNIHALKATPYWATKEEIVQHMVGKAILRSAKVLFLCWT